MMEEDPEMRGMSAEDRNIHLQESVMTRFCGKFNEIALRMLSTMDRNEKRSSQSGALFDDGEDMFDDDGGEEAEEDDEKSEGSKSGDGSGSGKNGGESLENGRKFEVMGSPKSASFASGQASTRL